MNEEHNKFINDLSNCNERELVQYIELWKERSNDEFAKELRKLIDITDEYYKIESQRTTNPIEHFLVIYSIDGDKRTTYNKLVRFVYNEFSDARNEVIETLVCLESLLG